ncbi:MAG: T9SS type A sorting domain-containing protein [Ignavibacteriales bacterium]|nr:T9SS type A sorting domain-containing protein [Ignavibacteriales bacterium]
MAVGVITDYALYQNYPNPFNPSTVIRFTLPVEGPVNLSIFNSLGEQVAVLINGTMEAGAHEISFEPKQLSSGTYFYKLVSGNFQ